jgi:3-hydroxyisobutyrate dehydrogenase-like beta-hydroxyacid dehydrogenase
MQVGFIGLGSMGSGIAARLIEAGHTVAVYNRNAVKAEPLVKMGARLAASPAEAARGEAVITMLADDHAVEHVVFGDEGILAALKPGAIHISMSTISVALVERLERAHRDKGQRLVSAPVFGRPDLAASGKLFVLAAGETEAVATCEPLFAAIGQRTFEVADEPAKANLVKLAGNFLISAVIEGLSEALALVGKAGLDKAAFLDLLTSTLFGAPVYKTYGGLIVDERYQPAGFRAELGLKDAALALAAAKALKVPMPLASLISDRFLTLIAGGGAKLDWSALGLLAKRDAGETETLRPSG